MRMGDLVGKEIVNYYDGARLGIIAESDVTIDPKTGQIQSIILPRRNNMMNFWVEKQHLIIPWESIKKIGAEIIIVELDQTNLNFHKYSV